jgi:outer membrane phospholipase A
MTWHLMRRLAIVPAMTAATCAGAETIDFLLDKDRFAFFEDNYALYHRMQNNGWAANDEWALRGHYSVKFRIVKPAKEDIERAAGNKGPVFGCNISQSELFVAYTGEFDFYMGTRPSGPVINRLSNPSLHYRMPLGEQGGTGNARSCASVGIEHRSDGQTTEVTQLADAQRAQLAYERRDRAFFDQVSRGSNYISLAAEIHEPAHIKRLAIKPKLKLYIDKDSAITWGPLAGTRTSISDYDRLETLFRYEPDGRLGAFEFRWTIGDSGFKTDSMEFGWHTTRGAIFPLYVRLHVGPMNTISNYTQRQDSIGIGLRFTGLGW